MRGICRWQRVFVWEDDLCFQSRQSGSPPDFATTMLDIEGERATEGLDDWVSPPGLTGACGRKHWGGHLWTAWPIFSYNVIYIISSMLWFTLTAHLSMGSSSLTAATYMVSARLKRSLPLLSKLKVKAKNPFPGFGYVVGTQVLLYHMWSAKREPYYGARIYYRQQDQSVVQKE